MSVSFFLPHHFLMEAPERPEAAFSIWWADTGGTTKLIPQGFPLFDRNRLYFYIFARCGKYQAPHTIRTEKSNIKKKKMYDKEK